MTNPNITLYEEILNDFAEKPTAFSATSDIENMERALIALNESSEATLVRYHTYAEMPTFLYELTARQTWILIDRIANAKTKVVVRSFESLAAVADALALVSGIHGEADVSWSEAEPPSYSDGDDPFADDAE